MYAHTQNKKCGQQAMYIIIHYIDCRYYMRYFFIRVFGISFSTTNARIIYKW